MHADLQSYHIKFEQILSYQNRKLKDNQRQNSAAKAQKQTKKDTYKVGTV